MSYVIPQTFPSPTDITTTFSGVTSTTNVLRASVDSKRLSSRPSSRPSSHAGTSATAKHSDTSGTVRSGSHVITHAEIMATVLRSMAALKTSDEKFCECLNEKRSQQVQLLLPPEHVDFKKAQKKVEKIFDPRLYQRTLDSMSIQSDEFLHSEHLWKAANDQKSQTLACTTKSSRCPSVKDAFIKNHQFGRAIDWGMEKEFWLSYIPNRCKVKGFNSGTGGFWTSQRTSKDSNVFQELETELVTGNRIPPAERCARYECQLEWEVYHKCELDKKSYERSSDSRKNSQLKKSLSHYRNFASTLISNLKDEQSKTERTDVAAESRRFKRSHHNKLDRIYKAYRILQSVEKQTQTLPPILATQYLSSVPQKQLWMNLLDKDDILEVLTNSIANSNDEEDTANSSTTELNPPNPLPPPSQDPDNTDPEQLSCDYPELLSTPPKDPPGIIWPRNISLLDIPNSFMN